MIDKIQIYKTRKVKTPSRGTSRSAGMDFYIPDDLRKEELAIGGEYKIDPSTGFVSSIVIGAGEGVTVPSGIKVKIPSGYCMHFLNKSGIASKKNLLLGACLVDEDYQGEILINVHNVSNTHTTIRAGEKLAQFIMYKVEYPIVEEVNSEKELFSDGESERSSGGFGSTGLN